VEAEPSAPQDVTTKIANDATTRPNARSENRPTISFIAENILYGYPRCHAHRVNCIRPPKIKTTTAGLRSRRWSPLSWGGEGKRRRREAHPNLASQQRSGVVFDAEPTKIAVNKTAEKSLHQESHHVIIICADDRCVP